MNSPIRTTNSYRALVRTLATSIAVLGLSTSLTPTTARAQQTADAPARPATGSVQGRVLNSENGKYLPNVRITVPGTTFETMTGDFGDYRLDNLPAGQVKIVAEYTGQAPKTVTVTVPRDSIATQNISFGRGHVREDGTVELDELRVEADRFKNAKELAINEERMSVTLKNVVASDAFGRIPEGNIGEFVKFVPGVQVNYGGAYTSDADASSITIRGFGPETVAITVDGMPMSSANPAGLTRAVGLDMLSINNASRVEVIKVATPDMPGNSPGGSVNLVSKSAFEYARPTYNWSVYMSVNSERMNVFKKTPGPGDHDTYKTLPGGDFTVAVPISSKFGFSVTGSTSNQFNVNHRARPEWQFTPVNINLTPIGGPSGPTTNAEGFQSDLAHPYLKKFSLTDDPRFSRRHAGSIKVDWRPWDGHAFSFGYSLSVYSSVEGSRRLQITSGTADDWGPTFVTSHKYSTTGGTINPGSVAQQDIDMRDKTGITHSGRFSWNYIKGAWDIRTAASLSTSRGSYKDEENGHFSALQAKIDLGQVYFKNINDGIPGSIEAYGRNGSRMDYTKLQNWSPDDFRASSGQSESMSDTNTYRVDVLRQLDFIPLRWASFDVKVGWYREENIDKKWGRGTGFRRSYLSTAPALRPADYIDDGYRGVDPGFGFAPQEWISTYSVFKLWKAHPEYFGFTESDLVKNYDSTTNQTKRITETSDQYYAMLNARMFNNRLKIVTGGRMENKTRDGRSPYLDAKWNYIKNTDGSLYRDDANPQGVRLDQSSSVLFANTTAGQALRSTLSSKGIAFPSAPIVTGTLAQRQLNLLPNRPVHGETKGKFNPMVGASFEITKKLVGRLALSKTTAHADYENGDIGLISAANGFSVNENTDPTATYKGTIKVANPNLSPEETMKWDAGLTYYTESGGKLEVSYYLATTKNFQVSTSIDETSPEFTALLESLGLDWDNYHEWQITSAYNGPGTARQQGIEVEATQDLGFLGDWGKHFYVFASFAKKWLHEELTNKYSEVKPSSSNYGSAGVIFNTKRISFNVRATYRDATYSGQIAGTPTYQGNTYRIGRYNPSEIRVDSEFNYRLSKHYSLFITGRDITNAGRKVRQYDLFGVYPDYAQLDTWRQFGVQVTFGVSGSF
ncbi:hypothetical protein DB347_09250 [Opitutaceae bacterium EW11]|nr:hypothetical protein DB347_09250 [Opitutaceae bacterium EW11]